MVFSEIRDRIEALVKLGGWANVQPEPDFAFLSNEGLRILTRQTCHIVEDYTLTLVADQVDYDLNDTADPRQWIAFNDDAQLNDTTYLHQSSRDTIRAGNRVWRTTPSSTPVCWYWSGSQKLGLYPPSSTSGGTITFQGPRHESVMDADGDTPELDADFHEGICLFGAWHHGKLYARGEERNIVAAYLAEGEEYVRKVKDSMASHEAQLVVRRVGRQPQEYSGLGPLAPSIYWPG